jgi:hypothetical protein
MGGNGRKKVKKLLAGIMAVVVSGSAQAANITYTKVTRGYDITIDGKLEANDGKNFEDIANHVGRNPGLVILNSPGGSVMSALAIGKSIRSRGWDTQVKDEECLSSCALIWIAGVKRWASEKSLIGFHAVYNGDTGEESGRGNALVGAFLKEIGLSDEAIGMLTLAPPDMVIYLTAEGASKYSIPYEGKLPPEAMIQILLQLALREKKPDPQPQAPPPAPSQAAQPPQQLPPAANVIVAHFAANMNLREAPTPFSANVLEYVWPNYIPEGWRVTFSSFNSCTKIYSGDVWCKIDHKHENGYVYSGWVNAYYLTLDDGSTMSCHWPGAAGCNRE